MVFNFVVDETAQKSPEEVASFLETPTSTEVIETITHPAPLDLEVVKTALKVAYSQQISDMAEQAKAFDVSDDETEKGAIVMAGQAKKLLKAMDDKRKQIIAEPDEFVRGVNGIAKMFRDQLAEIETGLKKKVSDYGWKKELERRAEGKRLKEEAEALQKKIDAEAKKAGVEAPPPPPAPVIKKETVTRTESGSSAHLRTEWKMTGIVDFKAVPDEYKELNTKAVNAAIKAGTRNIPGLKIEEVPTTVLRA